MTQYKENSVCFRCRMYYMPSELGENFNFVQYINAKLLSNSSQHGGCWWRNIYLTPGHLVNLCISGKSLGNVEWHHFLAQGHWHLLVADCRESLSWLSKSDFLPAGSESYWHLRWRWLPGDTGRYTCTICAFLNFSLEWNKTKTCAQMVLTEILHCVSCSPLLHMLSWL